MNANPDVKAIQWPGGVQESKTGHIFLAGGVAQHVRKDVASLVLEEARVYHTAWLVRTV